MIITSFSGVVIPGGFLGAWSNLASSNHPAYAAAAPAAMRKRRAATAPFASVNRGTF